MTYRINVTISYEPPGKPLEQHYPGETADLAGWPDLDRLVREGAITPIAEPLASPSPKTKKVGGSTAPTDGGEH